MAEALKVGRFSIPESEIEETFTTSGGPGGQHANRSNTAVELRFDVSASSAFPAADRQRVVARLGPVVVVTASESRSQWRNRSLARQRLAERLEEALRPPPRRRRPTKPSRSARQKRLEEKRRRSEKKQLRKRPDY